MGKKKCRILKEIRQKIADENDISYVTHECGFQGECAGTCPRCESELRYLEGELKARAAAGKRIAIAALCAGMTFGLSGCTTPFSAEPQGPVDDDVYVTTGGQEESGANVPDISQKGKTTSSGNVEGIELSGDVVYIPENSANE